MRFIVTILIIILPQILFAQHPTFTLYPVNPLLINPAFTGMHGRGEVLLNYRQQWLGIKEAPSISTFQFDKAVTPQISMGVQAQRIERGALNTNLGNILFSYKVLLGKSTNLNFGLAGGISSAGLNGNSTFNPADPAVANLPTGEINPDLKFGVNYHLHGLNLGVSFNEMIPNRPYATTLTDNTDLKFYENYIVNLDYKFHFNDLPLAIQPFGVYYHDKFLNAHVEGGALLHYNDLIYIGGLYRQNYGAGALAGLQYKDFRLGYGYEMASNMVDHVGQGSHEVQLSFRFGSKPTQKKPEVPQIADQPEQIKQETKEPEPLKTEEKQNAEEKDVIAQKPEKVNEVIKEQEPEMVIEAAPEHAVYYRGNHPNDLPEGYYVIAGAFDKQENARKNAMEISQQGVFAATGYNSERKLFFVYVYRSDSIEKTKTARSDFRKKTMLKQAWLLEIR